MGKTLHKLWIGAALIGLAACAREELGPVQYSLDQCRRVEVVDAGTGRTIRGAEDFAPDFANDRLFFTAYDRRAVERAKRKGRKVLPQGGVYAVAISDLFNGSDVSVTAMPLVARSEITGGLRPHGLSYDPEADEIVFVNRSYAREGRKWKMTPRLHRIGANGEVFVGYAGVAPCAANDVLTGNGRTFTSFDHRHCDWRAGVENVFAQKRSGVADQEGTLLFASASYANGLERLNDSHIVVAATRENALLTMVEDEGGLVETARIKTPGGPDNVTIAHDSGVITAVHPSLLRLALNLKLGIGKAPSRVVKVHPETGQTKVLADDPTGKLFSAATVAVEAPEGIIAGSVTDKGVLVCQDDV